MERVTRAHAGRGLGWVGRERVGVGREREARGFGGGVGWGREVRDSEGGGGGERLGIRWVGEGGWRMWGVVRGGGVIFAMLSSSLSETFHPPP